MNIATGIDAHIHLAEPLRLGYLVDTLVTGGAERLVVTFAEAVRDRVDVSLTVFVLSDADTPFRRELEAMGTKVVALPGKNLVDYRRFRNLLHELRRHRIEYLHAHLASSTTLGAFACRLLGIPFATTIHNVRPSVKRVRLSRKLLHRAAMRLPGVQRIAVGQAVAEASRAEIGRASVRVVPNAVPESVVADAGARSRIRSELGLSDDTMALACVGAIIGQKAHDVLLEAFARVAAEVPDTVLLLIGDAREPDRQQNLERLAERLGITSQLRFLGQRGDIPDLLAASDIFVSSSHWEGAPVSLLEAMANGVPPVVTDVGENRLVLRDTGAILVPPQAPEALSRGLLDMICDPTLRLQTAATVRRRALGTYGVKSWTERLLDIYAETGNRRDWRRTYP
ncbi:glycosyltransferase [Limimaricola soesokkakensis]|uniref:glycosyltransferase n=1 Tax=Limimaricola soesokkakensis TaxID=1343159 RepID=UPI003517865F